MPLALALPAQITWRTDFAATLEAAKTEAKVVFVAVNMDGERANDEMAKETYHDKVVTSLASRTLNLIASNAEHSKSGDCPRFGGLTCEEHRKVDIRVRENVLKPDADGFVISPQHVFLDPGGQVLLSVPYVVSAEELEWCFVKALKMVDPQADVKASSKARAPKRLLLNSVIDTAASGAAGAKPNSPASREEVLALIKEVKKGRSADRGAKIRRIMSADEPEALEFISQEVRSLKSKGSDPGKQHRELLSDIGRLSPASYWELVAELADNHLDDVRAASAAAFEQLAAEDALKTIRSVLRKEKEPRLQGQWWRAMASCAPADKKLRKDLLKNAAKAKEPTVRIQSIVALGYLTPGADVREAIESAFEDSDELTCRAAACAMAISRDSTWLPTLETKLASLESGEWLMTLTAAKEVLVQGRLELLCTPLMEVCGDKLPRPRFFGWPPI